MVIINVGYIGALAILYSMMTLISIVVNLRGTFITQDMQKIDFSNLMVNLYIKLLLRNLCP